MEIQIKKVVTRKNSGFLEFLKNNPELGCKIDSFGNVESIIFPEESRNEFSISIINGEVKYICYLFDGIPKKFCVSPEFSDCFECLIKRCK